MFWLGYGRSQDKTVHAVGAFTPLSSLPLPGPAGSSSSELWLLLTPVSSSKWGRAGSATLPALAQRPRAKPTHLERGLTPTTAVHHWREGGARERGHAGQSGVASCSAGLSHLQQPAERHEG